MEHYTVYITTNEKRTHLFVDMTRDLRTQLLRLRGMAGERGSEAGRFRCYHLIYLEKYDSAHLALAQQKKIRSMSRKKQEELVRSQNPMWKFREAMIIEKD